MKLFWLRFVLSLWNTLDRICENLVCLLKNFHIFVDIKRSKYRILWYKEYCKRHLQSTQPRKRL